MWTIYFIGMFIYLSIVPKRVYNYTYMEKGFATTFWVCLGLIWPILLFLLIAVSTVITIVSTVAYIFVPALRKDMKSSYLDIIEEIKNFAIIKES